MNKYRYIIVILAFIAILGWSNYLDTQKELEALAVGFKEAQIEAQTMESGYKAALQGKTGELARSSEDQKFILGLADKLEELFKRTAATLAKLDKVIVTECHYTDYSVFPIIYGKVQAEWEGINEDYGVLGLMVDQWIQRQPKPLRNPAI